jgi:hypothetical protein
MNSPASLVLDHVDKQDSIDSIVTSYKFKEEAVGLPALHQENIISIKGNVKL